MLQVGVPQSAAKTAFCGAIKPQFLKGTAMLTEYEWEYEDSICACPKDLDMVDCYNTRLAVPDLKTKRMLGFELEVIYGDYSENPLTYGELSEKLDDIVDHTDPQGKSILIKKDGSVDLEFVSYPHELSVAIQTAKNLAGKLRDLGFHSWKRDQCGFHIHVNRKGVKGIRKILRWCRDNSYLLKMFSGRSNYSARWCNFTFTASRTARYRAINLCPTSTIEFRFPRGSLKEDTLEGYLAFVDTLCKEGSNLYHTTDTEDFGVSWWAVIASSRNKALYELAPRRLKNLNERLTAVLPELYDLALKDKKLSLAQLDTFFNKKLDASQMLRPESTHNFCDTDARE